MMLFSLQRKSCAALLMRALKQPGCSDTLKVLLLQERFTVGNRQRSCSDALKVYGHRIDWWEVNSEDGPGVRRMMIETIITELNALADEWALQAYRIKTRINAKSAWGKSEQTDFGRAEVLRKNATTIREYVRGLQFQIDSLEKAPDGVVGQAELFLWKQQAIKVILEAKGEAVGPALQLAARNRALIDALIKERADNE